MYFEKQKIEYITSQYIFDGTPCLTDVLNDIRTVTQRQLTYFSHGRPVESNSISKPVNLFRINWINTDCRDVTRGTLESIAGVWRD